jgi:hypothetical protein
MWCNIYDEDGNLLRDEVTRERFMLNEEAKRLKSWLDDVQAEMEFEVSGEEAFATSIKSLERIRLREPDRASRAERLLNQAATINLSFYWHDRYIKRNGLPIDIREYLTY